MCEGVLKFDSKKPLSYFTVSEIIGCTSCIYRKDVEFPSDMLGFAYVEYRIDVSECFEKLVRELQGVGYRFQNR